MKPGHDSQASYRDLIERAEAYFKTLLHKDDSSTPHGVERWLNDLTETRVWELIESHNGLNDPDDLPDLPEVPI